MLRLHCNCNYNSTNIFILKKGLKKNQTLVVHLHCVNLNDFTVLLLQNDEKLRMIGTIHRSFIGLYEV